MSTLALDWFRVRTTTVSIGGAPACLRRQVV